MKFFVLAFAIVAVTAAAVAPLNDYLPPEPSSEYLPPANGKSGSSVTEDGYRYKTVHRLRYRARNRRDLSSEYLPPVQGPSSEYLPPAEPKAVVNGYRSKTVRRLKYRARHRRDVSELPSSEYLPPVEGANAGANSGALSADGYRYKTVRRLRYRRRRREADPEPEAEAGAAAPPNEYLPPVEGADAGANSGTLSADGYRYKTVRRLRHRRRRREADPEPKAEAEAGAAAPSNEYLPPVKSADAVTDSGALSADGYRYKTVRRLRYRRRRREANPEPEAEAGASAAAPSNEYLPPVESADGGADSGALSTNGYLYKTVRRLRYRRRRREANAEPEAEAEAGATALYNEYLPPVEGADVGADSGVLSADGYSYKTVRQLRYRRRRREVEAEAEAKAGAEGEAESATPVNEYLPPAEASADAQPKSPKLTKDGYHYRTVKRLKYRYCY